MTKQVYIFIDSDEDIVGIIKEIDEINNNRYCFIEWLSESKYRIGFEACVYEDVALLKRLLKERLDA
jgi:hypothetical protein